MRFIYSLCSNNLLYPKEDKRAKKLLYLCLHCGHKEPTTNMCIARNEIQHTEEY
jgi:DNA-directed RNA polymerase II subunit RPB9